MLKIVVSLIIVGLCLHVAEAATPTPTSQMSTVSSSLLNSSAVTVYSAKNQTDAAIWDGDALTTATSAGVPSTNVVFGPGATNITSYVYGYTIASSKLANIYKRTLNATLVGLGSDTTEASVYPADITITSTTPAATYTTAVSPGYLAILSQGSDGTNNQVYLNLVTGSSATQKQITSTSDTTTACATGVTTPITTTTFNLGNVWYDIGAGAFFYTYNKNVKSIACTSGATGATTYTNNIYLGGYFTSGTAYWTSGPLTVAVTLGTGSTTTATPLDIFSGGDNWLNSSYIYIVYKDTTATVPTTYVSKTAKSSASTAVGAFSSLIADTVATTPSTSTPSKIYTPVAVWSSAYTYGVAVAYTYNTGAAASTTYNFSNFLNGTTTPTDSGLSVSTATSASSLWGWQLNTGYTLLGVFGVTTGSTYSLATFYANGTANMTQGTLASSLQGPVSVYEDLNGTSWIGWTDVDTANSFTYAGYLAKLQGQLNIPSSGGAKALSTFLALVFVFLASILAF